MNQPHTYAYLKRFESALRARSGYRKYFDPKKDAFYSMYNVSEYTFAPFRVLWRQMIPKLNAAVTSTWEDSALGTKATVTQHVVTLVAFEEPDEAHYFCAMINSSIAGQINASSSTGKSFGTPSVLDHIAIPRFDAKDTSHMKLAELSQEAHQSDDEPEQLERIQSAIDELAASVWGLQPSSFVALREIMDGVISPGSISHVP